MSPSILNFDFSSILLLVISSLLVVISIKLVLAKSLLETVIIMSVFSVLISVLYLLLDAPDVAMTEVALGSSLSTCVLLNFLKLVGSNGELKTQARRGRKIVALALCGAMVAALTLAGLALPEYGSATSPLQTHVSKYYLENTFNDTGLPSFVAAILASYRGYDTLGETSVILIAGLAVLLLLSRNKEDKVG